VPRRQLDRHPADRVGGEGRVRVVDLDRHPPPPGRHHVGQGQQRDLLLRRAAHPAAWRSDPSQRRRVESSGSEHLAHRRRAPPGRDQGDVELGVRQRRLQRVLVVVVVLGGAAERIQGEVDFGRRGWW
jgi:hypothetical protein